MKNGDPKAAAGWMHGQCRAAAVPGLPVELRDDEGYGNHRDGSSNDIELHFAEQDFDGSGDLCIRCHTMAGWQAGRSTPTDASALTDADAADGVGCDVCHKLTNPDDS